MPEKPKKPKSPREESWSFGSEAEYAKDKLWTVERLLALGFFILWVGMVADQSGGARAFRTATIYLVPLAGIWWPEIMRRYSAEHDPCTNTSYPLPKGCFRWLAWTWLLFPGIVWVFRAIQQ